MPSIFRVLDPLCKSLARPCITRVKRREGERNVLSRGLLPAQALDLHQHYRVETTALSVVLQPKEQMPGEAGLERGLAEVTLSQRGVEPNLSLELTQNLGFLQQAKLTENSHPRSRRYLWRILEWIQNLRAPTKAKRANAGTFSPISWDALGKYTSIVIGRNSVVI